MNRPLIYSMGTVVLAFAIASVQPVHATGSQKTEIRYVESSCSSQWKSWTFACCHGHTTRDDCVKANPGKSCVSVDFEAQREAKKNSRAYPAC
jgi:hypothetical protein